MRRFALTLLLMTASAVPMAAASLPETVGTVQVSGSVGGRTATKSAYDLTVSYRGLTPKAFGDALLVYAEPSHILLFAHVNSRPSSAKAIGGYDQLQDDALALAYGPGRDFQHRVSLPRAIGRLQNSRIEVVMRAGGRDFLLASGAVNSAEFSFSTTYSAAVLPDGTIEYLGGEHCCSGGKCGRQCVSCPGAFFTCDLINCTISCETF